MRNKLLASLIITVAATPAFAQEMERRAPAQQPGAYNPAQYDYTFSQGSGAIPALPLQVQNADAAPYINGGIGDEELAQVKAQAAQYNLRVMLSAPSGEYISDVRLRVLDESGKALIDEPDAGPYLYAKLPAGSYTLETTSPGEAPRSETVTVPASRHITYTQQ